MGFGVAYVDQSIDILEERIMSELSDKIAKVKEAVDASVVRVTEDVANLQKQIDDLRTKVTTPEDIAALDGIEGTANALDPTKDDTLPEGEAPPAPLP